LHQSGTTHAEETYNLMLPIQVYLVDDNPEFLRAAAHFLATDPGIEIVGQALSSRHALANLTRLEPDLVLMDLAMPEMDGVEATRHIKKQAHAPRVIILTLYDNPEYRSQARAAGADGFVAKAEFGERLLPLIYEICGHNGSVEHPDEA
jgi:DNA-binding NarL/FixJ family response regulator